MADALGTESLLIGSTSTGFTYGRTPKRNKGLILALFVVTILIGGILVIIYVAGDARDNSPSPAPTDSYLLHGAHMRVQLIARMSRFRSAAGGSWPGVANAFNHNNTCGSLKHWFQPFPQINASDIIIYSPLQGTISQISLSQGSDTSFGYDIRIQGSPSDHEAQYLVEIGHVNITDHETIQKGELVLVGEPLGHHIGHFVNSDLSVLNQSAYDEYGEYISMFNVMDDGTLKLFQQWNVTNRTYPVITDPQRRIYPLNCTEDNQIVEDKNYDILANWVYLNTTFAAVKKQKLLLSKP